MFHFFDTSKKIHYVNFDNLNNVHISDEAEQKRCSFHFLGPHVLSVVVDEDTLNEIEMALDAYSEPEYMGDCSLDRGISQ